MANIIEDILGWKLQADDFNSEDRDVIKFYNPEEGRIGIAPYLNVVGNAPGEIPARWMLLRGGMPSDGLSWLEYRGSQFQPARDGDYLSAKYRHLVPPEIEFYEFQGDNNGNLPTMENNVTWMPRKVIVCVSVQLANYDGSNWRTLEKDTGNRPNKPSLEASNALYHKYQTMHEFHMDLDAGIDSFYLPLRLSDFPTPPDISPEDLGFTVKVAVFFDYPVATDLSVTQWVVIYRSQQVLLTAAPGASFDQIYGNTVNGAAQQIDGLALASQNGNPIGQLMSTVPTIVTPPQHGTATINPQGQITYTPGPNAIGTRDYLDISVTVPETTDSYVPTIHTAYLDYDYDSLSFRLDNPVWNLQYFVYGVGGYFSLFDSPPAEGIGRLRSNTFHFRCEDLSVHIIEMQISGGPDPEWSPHLYYEAVPTDPNLSAFLADVDENFRGNYAHTCEIWLPGSTPGVDEPDASVQIVYTPGF